MANTDRFFDGMNKHNSDTMNVAVVGEITSLNSNMSAVVKVLFEGSPTLVNVPVMFLNNFKFPIKTGYKVLILFLDYDSDNLFIDGVTTKKETDRVHALDDAIAIPLAFNPLQSNYTQPSDVEINSDTDINLSTASGSIKVSELLQEIEDLKDRIMALGG